MPRASGRIGPRFVPLLVALAWIAPGASGQGGAPKPPSARTGEWAHYAADVRGSRYLPLDQINASNFNKLELPWRSSTRNLGPRPEFNLEGTPLMVNAVLYATGGGGGRRSVVALDPKSGELLWKHGIDEGKRAEVAPRRLSGRGLAYWTDGRGDELILYITIGYRLVCLNAKTGQPIQSFGTGGIVDMKVGALIGQDGKQVPIDLETGEIGLHSTPMIAGNIAIIGTAFLEGLNFPRTTNTKGFVPAYDVRTGKQLWRFETMPGPGQFGHDTWENGSWEYTGNTGVWTFGVRS
jgi:quinoprotein glucose dehydrogenase